MFDEDKFNGDIKEPSLASKFSKLLSELKECNEDEQRKKIGEMNEIVDEMNMKEFDSILTIELFNKINNLMKEKKPSFDNPSVC
ncbi:uncharacterized protein MONOS_9631 [Monocercomonoides exilis]|uniref:uncharacterized protein n=1 Tax=Monocercomonoides exilis TaxID=2049356 RepID=UPI00355953B0|nr:hypothetical protein MONOS_9631 [Monocercomonoides exilis]|eukprot:MONOS_9631.1-p1 / transcript=MONOS_9631.1 / gene=MONOS_9631 / organism=Monocercomonoides_exilis_PA203 / gene_product=unspecified product / transcript_product=unspecified product / location=Mono_scaffold00404:5098-5413(+) / protein_length=84 / sequence_SO=supercontig / SO=protein_coding / is_pseudo=false